MRRAAAVVLVALALAGGAVAQSGTLDYAETDPGMVAAMEQARETFDAFLAAVLAEDGEAMPDAAVKVAIPLADGPQTTEVIWVTPFRRLDGGGFEGRLANQPVYFDARAGDTVPFGAGDVRDWYVYGSDGRMYGSFTTRVMLPDLAPADRVGLEEILSDDPLPTDW